MSDRRQFAWAGEQRGLSNVLGLVLVLGMIVAATMVIVVVGATAFATSEETVSMESAVTAMEELNTELMAVAGQANESASVSIPSMEGAELNVEDTGWVNISVEYDNGTLVENQTTGRIQLGKIVYQQDDQSVAIQGGGVWRTNRGGDSVAIVDRPTFQYRYGNGNPTLVFPILNLTGTSIDGGEATVRQVAPPADQLASVNPLQPGTQLNITVQSDYYLGWRGLFESETNGTVDLLGNERVRLVLFGPDLSTSGGLAPGAVLAPYSSAYATNANLIDSYDSRIGPYSDPAQTHNDTFAAVNRSFEPNSQVFINGELHVGGEFKPTDKVNITGEVRVGGNVSSITRLVEIGFDGNKTFSVGGDMEKVTNAPEFYGDVIVGGDVGTTNLQGYFYQDLHVGDDIVLTRQVNQISGDVITGGNVTANGAGVVQGAIHANGAFVKFGDNSYSGPEVVSEGDVFLNGSSVSVNADVTSGGDVIISGGSGVIQGDINASGNVILAAQNTMIVGHVRAGGDVILSGTNSQITGDVNASGEVRITAEGSIDGTVAARQSTDGDNDAIEIPHANGEITGNAISGEQISTSGGSVSGSKRTNMPVPAVSVTADPREPAEPLDPRIPRPNPAPATSLIETRGATLNDTQNYVSDPHPVEDITDADYDSACDPCRLDEREYYIENFVVEDWVPESVVFNTTEHDIEVYVENQVKIDESVRIEGGNQVIFYVNGTSSNALNMQGDSAVFGNLSSQNASQLTVFMRPDAGVSMGGGGHPKFVGVIYGPGSPSTPGVNVHMTNDAEVWGSVIGNVDQMSRNARIHYDEALAVGAGGTRMVAHGPEQVQYVQLSVLHAMVE